MRKNRNSILFFLFLTSCIIAQENDFQVWSSWSVNDKVTYKTEMFLKHSLRFRENASLLSKSFSEIKIKYKYDKRFSIAIGFRDINEWNQKLIREYKKRYFSDIYIRKKKKRYSFSIRNRLQRQGNINYDYMFRQKFSCSYNIRKNKLTPLLSIEYFLNQYKEIKKLRYTMALAYPLSKDLDLDISYRLQKELYVANPETLFIFDGKLSYAF